jgi:hypothetical protein
MTEQWRPITGCPGYQVSDAGRVRSPRKVLKPLTGNGGYCFVHLWVGPKMHRRAIHRLVLIAFEGDRPGLEACHNNGDKRDNRLANLRWDTRSANVLDMVRHGTHNNARKTHCPAGHPYSPENTYTSSGRRQCVTCTKAKAAAAHRRKKESA